MSAEDDARKVVGKISGFYDEGLRPAMVALCEFEKQNALNYFLTVQVNNRFWDNQTYQALTRVFAKVINEPDSVGFLMAHGVNYGVYLELANDRKHEALRPIIENFGSSLVNDMQKLMDG